MKVKNDEHRRLMDKLESVVDLEHVEMTEKLHDDLWAGRKLPHLPCVFGRLPLDDWPIYSFSERWNDIEKNFIHSLGGVYGGALLKDDRLYQVRPEYGVVNIPELFGINSVVSNEGNSMSEGLNDLDAVLKLIDAGVPDFDSNEHNRKILEFEAFVTESLADYEKLSKVVHMTLPDTQGPFDLACLIWGTEAFIGMYDEPEVFENLMQLVTETFIRFNRYHKERIAEPIDSAYHIAGLKLVDGGVRICDDSATLVSPDIYAEKIAPRNGQAFAPFSGGWLHYCGDGNKLLPTILNDIPGVHAVHLGNPDSHDFARLAKDTAERGIVLYWSGALEELEAIRHEAPDIKLCVLLENRYAPKSMEDAKWRLDQVRQGRPVPKSKW